MNDRNGDPIVVGDLYVVVGEALGEFSADRVALDTARPLVADHSSAGNPPTMAHVSTDLVPVSSLGGGGGSGHDPVTVTDSSSVNLTLTGQDVTAAAIFGTTSGTVCQGDDARLSDARTPTAHTHPSTDITGLGTAATQNTFGSGDPLGVLTAIASFSAGNHTHNGIDGAQLAQANTHQSADTDSATTAIHHTLGTGANQAAAGNHTHVTYVRLTSDFVTSSATAVDVTGLSFTPAANTTYDVRGHFLVRTATTTVGPRPGCAWPTGLTDGVASIYVTSSTTAQVMTRGNSSAAVLAPVGGLPNTTQSYPGQLEATIVAGASPSGTFNIQLASETAGTNVTMKAGSWICYRVIP